MMNMLHKWDFEKREYEEVPNELNIKTMYEMDEVVPCVNCQELTEFGEMYTSRQWHTARGFGYSVCEKCKAEEYRKEHEVR